MDIWYGYIGLAIAFVIIATIFLWFFLRTPGRIIIKVIMIPITIWYSLVLYYTIPNLMGWPTSEAIPENSQILAFRIKEPNPKHNDPGAIYFWLNTKPSSNEPNSSPAAWLNPKRVFSYNSATDPRAYQLPYSREMHKKIIESQRKARGVPGAQVRIKKKGQGNPSQEESKAPLEFEILNPVKLLPK
jgi:hypothetical protein